MAGTAMPSAHPGSEARRRRRYVSWALALVGLLALAVVVGQLAGARPVGPGTPQAAPDGQPTATTSEAGAAAQGAERHTRDSGTPGVEVPGTAEPADAGTPAPGAQGTIHVPAVLQLPAEPPPHASATGKIASGFPNAVVPLADGARVLSSDVSGEGRRIQVALEASAAAGVEEVLAFYQDAFGALGFVSAPSPAVPGTTAVAFTRGPHTLLLSVRRDGDEAAFSVAGVLETAG